ncbi:MAG: protein kinase [Candidatus Aminicenantes bacterium]|jgi:serine/threonine-protein kinase
MGIKCTQCHHENPDDTLFCGKCAARLPSPEEPEITETLETPQEELATGTTFAGRYQIIEELGKGGMGRVYKALDKEINAKVALKLIKPEISADRKTIERFRKELKIARDITHKNVCRMYDLNKEGDSYFITMEYVSGEDLKSFIRRSRQLTIGTAITIAKQVCEGLSEAHKSGVVHRDLKPSNIMIDNEGNVRIMDFGIARFLKEKGITGTGVIIGTPEYMSPEQVEGKELDQRSDIYSLGIVLYEMVTGQVPFEGDTPFALGMKHKSEIPHDPRKHNAQIPDDLSQVILRCLEKEKEKRCENADELRDELEKVEKGIPTTEKPSPGKKPLTSKEITVSFGLKKLLIPALTIAALVIIAIAIWQLLPQKPSPPSSPSKPSIAVLPFDDLSPQKDQEYFCDGLTDELINRLTKIQNLRVPARTSVFSLKGEALGISEIGEKLAVANVLEGSLRRTENKLRITVQLVKVADGYPIWSAKYERDEKDIFSLQDEISLEIVDALQVELLGDTREKVMKRHTDNKEAYDSYLRGLWIFNNKFSEEDLRKAIIHLENAIDKDPDFSLAYVELANVYMALSYWHFLSPDDVLPETKRAIQQALKIDNSLGEAYDIRGFVKLAYEWDYAGAESDFKRALEFNPKYPWSHVDYAQLLLVKGKAEEAYKENLIAIDLDPLSPRVRVNYAHNLCYSGKYDEAIEECEKVLEIDSDYPIAHLLLGRCYLEKSLFDEAISSYQNALDFSGDSTEILLNLAFGYAVSGKEEEALEIIAKVDKLSEHKYIPNFAKAIVYAALKNKDKAFEYLNLAYKDRDPDLVYLKLVADEFPSEPELDAMLKKLNLE